MHILGVKFCHYERPNVAGQLVCHVGSNLLKEKIV